MNIRKLNRLKNQAYRTAYVESHIDQGLAHQVRALRDSRGWDQKRLAKELGLRSQSAIARMEDPSYGKLSLVTIKKLAKAFDVGVLVRFVPFSRLITEYEDLSDENLASDSFEAELPELEHAIHRLEVLKIYTSSPLEFIDKREPIAASQYMSYSSASQGSASTILVTI